MMIQSYATPLYSDVRIGEWHYTSEPEVPSFDIDIACRGIVKDCLTL